MSGVLEGLKVIEMGHFIAVPAAGAIFADWGADVIKVEPPDGEAFRGFRNIAVKNTGSEANWRFEVHNRNKRSMGINLRSEAGRDILLRLVKDADVFMSNYEFGVMQKLRLGYAELAAHNPALIYALITGYGTVGPDRDERGFDFAAAWARSGIQYLIGEPNQSPPQQRGGMMDRTAGAHMLAGILGALYHREKTGQGQEIEFSLYHSGIWTIAADYQVALGGFDLNQNNRAQALNPLWNNYQTKDGRWMQMAMLQADLSWADFCRALDRPDLEKDPRYATLNDRGMNCEALIKILDEVFATRDLVEWETRLKANNCIFSRVTSPKEVLSDPQVEANHFFQDIEHPEFGAMKYVTSPVTFRQNPASIQTTSPEAGQQTEEILLELGYSWEDIERLKDQKAII